MNRSSGGRGNTKGQIPSRWLHCPRKALELINGKLIAFKVPLDSSFDDQVPPACRFPPKMLFEICKSKKIQIGLWVDLTNTKRFYNKSEIESENCKYLKLACRGHGETPSEEQTKTFISYVDMFVSRNPLKCIAVHCTHGFNRTGFMIVSYLVEKMDFSLEVALQMFARVRPPGIYKGDYLRELYKKYDDVDEAPPSPEWPVWCYDNDENSADDDQEFYKQDNSCSNSVSSHNSIPSSSSDSRKSHKRRNGAVPQFMAGVGGVELFTEQPKAHQLQRQVHVMCGWKNKGFPGCQPVSMDINNKELLALKPYRVSWKADGTRYMMLIDGEDDVYFFDRDDNVFKVNGLRFVHKKDLRRHLTATLIDGEMVIDKVDGENIPRYLAYDIVKFEKQDVSKLPFYPVRLQCIEDEIIKPRYQAMEQGLINKALEPFSIRKKDFWHITQTENLLGEKFAKKLSHEPDGLIFQPSKEPYVAGRCDEVLKWKPMNMNSVDFRLKIGKEEGTGIVPTKIGYLFVGQYDKPFATIKYTKALKELDNKIIECKYEYNQWKFMRQRTDKSFPNSYNTAIGVCESIKTPVTKEMLVSFIQHKRYNDDAEIFQQPKSKRVRISN